jgi:hypothetical protein
VVDVDWCVYLKSVAPPLPPNPCAVLNWVPLTGEEVRVKRHLKQGSRVQTGETPL